MWSVLGKTLSVGTTTAPTSAEAPFATPVTGYGNEPYNTSNYTPWDFYQIPLINLELTVLSMMNGTGFWSFATLGMINSSSSTDLAASDNTRSVQVVNTNTTANNAAWISFRSYATNGIATLQSGAKIIAVFTSRTTTVLTADLAFLTNNAGTIAERMRLTGAGMLEFTANSSWGIKIFNTADKVTNFETVTLQWVSNVFQIRSGQWSSGTIRNILIWVNSSGDWTSVWTNITFAPSNITTNIRATSASSAGNSVVQASNSASSWVLTMNSFAGTVAHTGTAWYTGILVNVTESTTWSWAKNLILAQVWWTTKFWVDNAGKTTQEATMTAWGTTGNQTINKPTGSVNIAAAGSTVTVTNSTVLATSIVHCVIMTNDSTAILKNVVVSAWSFVITTTAAVTAETKIWFVVHN